MKSKIKYLDGLRGLAAFIVIVDHFMLAFYPALFSTLGKYSHTSGLIELKLSKTIFNILYDGNLSVCIFFILSGYVLTYKFFLTHDYEYIISGASKRYIRLMVPILFTMSVAYIFMKLSLFNNSTVAKTTLAVNSVSQCWTFKPSFLGMIKQATYGVFIKNQYSYYVSLWTMTYEFLGSFLVYSIAAILGRLRNRYIFYIIIVLLFIKTYYLAFILGMILSDLYNNYKHIKILNSRLLGIIFLIIGIFLGSYPLVSTDGTIYKFMTINFADSIMFYHITGAFFIMLALLNLQSLKKLFSSKLFYFLGQISFPMYLSHLIVLCSFSGFVFMKLLRFLNYHVAFIITFALSVPLIMLISYFIHKYIDLGGVKLSSYVYKKFFKSTFVVERNINADANK
ncbi:acyltransferase family protein [Clostridium neuense]|uniref:Acyltransferase family protein n=1 Tax=Clostridium neuense TaxID=1728934 RepID=A0ABW8TBQ4_9CLOT